MTGIALLWLTTILKKLKGWFDKYGFLTIDSNIEINRFTIKYLRQKLNHSAFNMKLKRKP